MTLDVQHWLDRYKQAWEARDADAAAALFTDDATYHEAPFDPPSAGPSGVREYWSRVTATQSDVLVRYGTVVQNGDRAAVEWWVTLRNGGMDVTLVGEFFLQFDDESRVRRLREYWHFAEGRHEPYDGWGS